jgi:PAS domain S-box-containing protein
MNIDFAFTQENMLGLISDHCPDLLALIDINGAFLYSNAAHLVRLGRSAESLQGCTIFDLLHPEDIERVEKALQVSSRRHTLLRVSARWVRDPGRSASFESLGKWVSADEGRSQYLLLASREISDAAAQAQTNGELMSLQREAALLLGRLEAERTQVARTIHDDLGQKLTAISIELSLWKADVDKGESRSVHAIREKISILSELANGMIGATRSLTTSLRPRILEEFGVVAAIEWLLEKFQRRTGIATHFSAKPEKLELDSFTSLQLFRVMDDLTRSMDESASKLQIRIEKRAGMAVLRMQGDGGGTKPAPEVSARVRIAGGEIECERGAIVISLPLK